MKKNEEKENKRIKKDKENVENMEKPSRPVRLEGDFQCSWENLITQSIQKAD